jgi:hypothetical protein
MTEPALTVVPATTVNHRFTLTPSRAVLKVAPNTDDATLVRLAAFCQRIQKEMGKVPCSYRGKIEMHANRLQVGIQRDSGQDRRYFYENQEPQVCSICGFVGTACQLHR